MLSTLTRAYRAFALFLGSSTASRISAAICRALPANPFRSVYGQSNNTFAFFETLENRAMMSATYYVNPSGNDSSAGTSISAPWKTIGKINGVHLNAGDKVLFQGGQTFGGTMHLYNDGGSASDPVIIGSYGSGRATLSAGTGTGIWILNSQGITVENLVIKGSPGNTGEQDGIRIETDGGTKSGFTVTDCDVSGFAQAGIQLLADGSGEYLSGVTLTDNNVYDNVVAGIQAYANGWYITDLTIDNNLTHDNYGNNGTSVSGSGISLGGVNDAMVSNNSSYNNGVDGNGAVGIWAYSSNAVTFQYNQSYDNHAAKIDGDGFDFDADTSNSVMQYNLAYNNDGGGYMLDQWKNDSLSTNDIVRFNVSENDARKFNYGEIESWGRMLNSSVYNNVIYTTPNSTRSNVAIRIHNSSIPGLYSSNVHFDNNVIDTTGGVPLVLIPSGETQGMKNVTFNGNVYYSNGATLSLELGGNRYSTLAGWQSAGQEKLNGAATGLVANPLFKAAGGETPTGGTFSIASMAAYDLQSSSPILNAGVNLSTALGIAIPASSSAKTIPGIDQSLLGSKATAAAQIPTPSVGTATAPSTPVTTTTTSTTTAPTTTTSTATPTAPKTTTTTTTSTTPTNVTTTASSTMTLTVDVYNDANKNGTKDSGEAGLRDWTAYIDSNNNGKLDSGESEKTTDAAGTFSFTALKPGTYTIRVVPETGYTATTAASTVTLSEGKTVTVEFGEATGTVYPAATVATESPTTSSATTLTINVFNDANKDGIQDDGEAGLRNWTVYIDSNDNGKLDPGESEKTTNADGTFSFTALKAGTYLVRIVPKTGEVATTPAFETVTLETGKVVQLTFGEVA